MSWRVNKREFDSIKSNGIGILEKRGCLNTCIGEKEVLLYQSQKGRERRLKIKITGIVPTGRSIGQPEVNLSVILPKHYGKDFRVD